MRYLRSTTPRRSSTLAFARLDGAVEPAKAKNKKVTAFVLSVTVLFFVTGGVASATEPGWHLSTQSLPTNLPAPHSGVARNTVFDLSYEANEGELLIVDENRIAEPAKKSEFIPELLEIQKGERTREQLKGAAFLPFDATPQAVQEAFEKHIFPAHRVQVSGRPGSYVITFPGQAPGNYGYQNYALLALGPVATGFPVKVAQAIVGSTPLKQSGTPVEPVLSQSSSGRPDGQLIATAANLGEVTVTGESSPIVLSYRLPPGLEAVGVGGYAKAWSEKAIPLDCSLARGGEPPVVTCTFSGTVVPFSALGVVISVIDTGATPGSVAQASVSGGEERACAAAPGAGKFKDDLCGERVSKGELEEGKSGNFETTPGGAVRGASTPRKVETGESTPFGVENYELVNEDEGGTPDTQAGSHPFQQTTSMAFNETVNVQNGVINPAVLPRDLHFKWPAGLIGNPNAIPQCPLAKFLAKPPLRCPPQSAVGVASVLVSEKGLIGFELKPKRLVVPVFNLVPSPGEPARFGFTPVAPVYIDASVRSGGDYGVTVNVENISQLAGVMAVDVSVWGTPGASAHDPLRGNACVEVDQEVRQSCEIVKVESPSAFLSMPASCPRNPATGRPEPLRSEVFGDSWADPKPASEQLELASFTMPALDGCGALPFNPSIVVKPDVSEASRPSGLNVDVHIPQGESLNPTGLAVAEPRDITVTLPEGVAVNPSSGDGLLACSEHLVGFEGFRELQPGFSAATFTGKLPGSFGSEETLQPGIDFCADASKIGTVRIKTPILPHAIEGAVYLASQNANPFGSLVAMYIVAEDPVSGVLVKLAGEVHLSATGQLTTTFENSPQAPFEDAELHFFGGERAPLATPSRCGAYTTTATLTPWSQEPGEPSRQASSTFNITSGPHGDPCPGGTLPFGPSLTAQTTDIQAGGFTPLSTTIGRADGQQDMQSVTLHFPPGVSGLLSGVKLCPEVQANEGTCGSESLIGETVVSAGVGSDPVSVKGGKVYITEKYAGAPFGLSIVNPVKAGPFDLEHDTANPAQNPACDCVVVRAKVQVDPTTAALTVTTDPSGPRAIPHLIDGIPVQIQKVNVLINRPGFTFNPTNCNAMSVTGAIGGVEGASSPVSVPFQVTNCAVLKFAPKFQVSTSGRTSKANGASLAVRLAYPSAPFGSQANIRSVKVDLPKLLPSRLTTLQKACTAAQFNTNPAGCPAASFIGHARAFTPLLPVVLEGPAIFVSHGGEAFPSLEIVLQGYGVTIDLVGSTFISKAGITSSTFKTVPDQPVSSFELTLPEGPYSALAANGNLCTSRLVMPTEFVAQNGAMIVQSTPVSVTGCAKRKALTRAQKLAAALRACNKKAKSKRAVCRASARRRYGPLARKKTKGKRRA